jgi:lipoprotein-anchoring transpeptidase ErfK/SrfK
MMRLPAAAMLLALSAACAEREDRGAEIADTPAAAEPATPAPRPSAVMRLEVDLSARQLYVYRDGQRVASHPVAVGSSEWPTETGEWTISQVVFNPEWIPPDESWAEERERKAPGASDNPLGRAQLVYDAPRSIHGTNDPSSIGRAVSHGSIRVSNDVAVQLARQVMEAGGAGRDDQWYRRAQQNRTEKQVVDLPNPVPIRVF